MYKLILLSIVQSALLVFGQMFLKFTMNKIDKLSFTWRCIKQLFTDWNFLLCGLCMGGASVLWFYILKHYPFSAAYPMISFSCVPRAYSVCKICGRGADYNRSDTHSPEIR